MKISKNISLILSTVLLQARSQGEIKFKIIPASSKEETPSDKKVQ